MDLERTVHCEQSSSIAIEPKNPQNLRRRDGTFAPPQISYTAVDTGSKVLTDHHPKL